MSGESLTCPEYRASFVEEWNRPSIRRPSANALYGKNHQAKHLGRRGRGQDAIAIVGVDELVPDDILERLRRLPQVREAKVLRF